MNSEIVSQTPAWYILFCLGLGIGLAALYYYRTQSFSKTQKRILALLRGCLVFLVSFLLLNPLIKTASSLIIKPKVLVLVDDSKSMGQTGNLKGLNEGLQALKKDISGKGYEVEVKGLDETDISELDKSLFSKRKTNLSAAFNYVKSNYEGQNLSDVILISDGIINDGVSPTFGKYPFNVHTVGYGDSTLKRDAFISGVAANKLAYLGNTFVVNVDVGSFLLAGKKANISVKTGDEELITQKSVSYTSDDTFETISFEIPAKTVGKQRYVVDLQVVDNEVSTKNNRREFIVDVVNGKEKILLLAYAPHPDLKAIKSILDKNDHFELKIKTIQDADFSTTIKEPFDVLILHQLPDVDNSHLSFLPTLLAKQKPTFFILGSKSSIPYFNGMQNIMTLNVQLNKQDKVTAQINPAFSLFSVSENQAALISKLPPLAVPFGNYTVQGASNVLLDQYVSGINASRPLLAVNLTGSRKMAAFVAEGLWQWRMEEFALTDTQQHLDDLITKTIQLISVKEEKGKLRVYPVADVFDVDQSISFSAEVYNEIYERIYDQDIKLKIKDKTYDFKVTESSSRFTLSSLPAGVYTYEATAKVLGKEETSSGQFVVSDSDIELQNTVADFGLLSTLAVENNGDFVLSDNIFELRNTLEKKGLINKIVSQEELKDLINLRWLLFLILLVASIEWGLRKYFGSY